MAFQIRSSARGIERRRTAVARTVICICVLAGPLPKSSAARAHPRTKPSRKTGKRFGFKVTDSENTLPIPGAAVCLVYW
jgi:hypothetical protein